MSVVGALLALVLCVATLGEGGASPDVLLALHLLATAAALAAWTAPGAGAFRAAPGIRIALAAFAACALASALAAPYGYAAILVLVEIAATLLAAFAACRSGPALPGRLAPVLAAALLAHAAAAIVRRVAAGELRPASSFLNPNHLAAWIVAAGFVVAGRLAARERAGLRGLHVAALAAGAVAFVLVGSRGATLGVAAGLAAGLLLAWPSLAPAARRVALVSTLAAAALGFAGVAWRFRTFDDPFAFQRLDIWRASLAAGFESPVLGLGPGQFAHESRRFNFPLEGETLRYARYFPSPHSDAVRVVVEFGIPAAIAGLAAAALAGAAVLRRRRAGALDPPSIGAAAALAALAAQGLVDDLSGRPALILLAAVLAGSLVAVPGDAGRPPRGRTVAALLAAGVLAWAVLDLAPWLSWRAQRELPRGPLDDAGRIGLDRSLARNPYHPDLHLRVAEDLAARAPGWTPREFARAAEAAGTAVRLSPRDPRNLRTLARVEAAACRSLFPFAAYRGHVAGTYERALASSPHDPTIALEAAGFLLDARDPAGAARLARIAADIEPRAALPGLLLAEALEASGDRDGSVRELDRAEQLERAGARDVGSSPYHAALLRLPRERVAALRARLSGAVGFPPGLEHQDVPQVVVPVPSPR
jgi:O-antigen ligase